MKTAIIVHSSHHGNTRKLAEAIASAHGDVRIFTSKDCSVNLDEYEAIGLASGIYCFHFHRSIEEIARKLPLGKKVFLLYTFGGNTPGLHYDRRIRGILETRNASLLGSFGCLGWNTFSFFGWLGGTAKGHPSAEDIQHAVEFYDSLK